jgi:hypothetical protein
MGGAQEGGAECGRCLEVTVNGDESWVEGERQRWRRRVVLSGGVDLREG